MFQYIHVTINHMRILSYFHIVYSFNTSMLLLIGCQGARKDFEVMFQYIHVTINLDRLPTMAHNTRSFNTSMLLLIVQ